MEITALEQSRRIKNKCPTNFFNSICFPMSSLLNILSLFKSRKRFFVACRDEKLCSNTNCSKKKMVRWNYERDACEFHISRAIVDFQKI